MDYLFATTQETNPLLVNTVVSCIFKFLPLHVLKQCRLVCQEWNSVSEPLIRKQAKVKFTSKFRPSDFLNHYLNLNTNVPDLPFAAFKFPPVIESVRSFYSELQDFVEEWGEKVKSLEFEVLTIMVNNERVANQPILLDIRPCIDLVAANLTNLKIGIYPLSISNLVVSLDKLVSIQTLFLSDCNVAVNSKGNRITPSTISLRDIAFIENGKKIQQVVINDFVNFSKCREIEIMCSTDTRGSKIIFYLSRDTFEAGQMDFCETQFVNWGNSNIITDSLILMRCAFETKTFMKIKKLKLEQCAVDLFLLPNTIEKLTLINNRYDNLIDTNNPTNFLPKLRCLRIFPDSFQTPQALEPVRVLSQFANCSNLVDVEILSNEFDDS